MVLLYENDFNRKFNEFIDNNQIVKIEDYSTINYTLSVNKAINKFTALLSQHNTAPLRTINLSAAKLHKKNIPIRPVVNFSNAPSH